MVVLQKAQSKPKLEIEKLKIPTYDAVTLGSNNFEYYNHRLNDILLSRPEIDQYSKMEHFRRTLSAAPLEYLNNTGMLSNPTIDIKACLTLLRERFGTKEHLSVDKSLKDIATIQHCPQLNEGYDKLKLWEDQLKGKLQFFARADARKKYTGDANDYTEPTLDEINDILQSNSQFIIALIKPKFPYPFLVELSKHLAENNLELDYKQLSSRFKLYLAARDILATTTKN